MTNKNIPLLFILLGLLSLMLGSIMGGLASIVYLIPDFLKDIIPFNRLRPLHVTSNVSWIILTATGGLYYYISENEKIQLFSEKLRKFHFILFAFTGIAIYASFLTNNMGGREYLTFLPWLTIPILLGWLLFGVNYYKSMLKTATNWPVYYWMWGTGIIFMIYHLSESHFWMFTHFRTDFIRDMTVQWKSYGSFTGSWNMLVYGTAFYIMAKIKDNINIARGKTTFFFFFLGLTNLMFGWAHHTYLLPTLPWVRYVAYGVSMTEWIILIRIINKWRKSISFQIRKDNLLAYQFLVAADVWVFFNLILALLISIPAINYFTHGTHITVAHTMGTTIGINTSILFASISFIVHKLYNSEEVLNRKGLKIGFTLFNWSLAVFLIALLSAGVYKGYWSYNHPNEPISFLHDSLHAVYGLFIIAGWFLIGGILMIGIPLFKLIYAKIKETPSIS